MKRTSNETKEVDDELIEEFDEKMKVQEEQEQEEFIESEKDEKQYTSKQELQLNNNNESSPVTPQEMDHIFNQFNHQDQHEDEGIRRPSLSTQSLPAPPPVPQEIPFDFNRFLEQMRARNSKPITRYFKSFLQAFDRRPWTVNEQIKIIQDFLDFIFIKMRECDVWRDMPEQEFDNAKEGMEKLVMNRLYHNTFCPNTTDDKERDEILHQKLSIFRWIREKHLDIPETEHNESFLSFAESEILKINNYKAPRDKLICILNCCKVIFGLIKHVEGDAGADKFLPILIYVVIRSNPPRLVSNVQYIYRFRNPDQLQAESGYYLTNLMGAISFIETMEANSLSITKEEFDANIERTMHELKQERPFVSIDKQQINYENAVHPSRSNSQPLMLDSTKAAALLERGSLFAQKTMQKPISFVGKIFQGLSDAPSSSTEEQQLPEQQPVLPPRPPIDQQQLLIQQQRQQFDNHLEILQSMFTNVDQSVCYLVLHSNHGDLSKSIDHLLDISNNNQENTMPPSSLPPPLQPISSND